MEAHRKEWSPECVWARSNWSLWSRSLMAASHFDWSFFFLGAFQWLPLPLGHLQRAQSTASLDLPPQIHPGSSLVHCEEQGGGLCWSHGWCPSHAPSDSPASVSPCWLPRWEPQQSSPLSIESIEFIAISSCSSADCILWNLPQRCKHDWHQDCCCFQDSFQDDSCFQSC